MKLFRKIFVQVMLGVLLVSQVTLGYSLWESRKQTMEDTMRYEIQVFHNGLQEFQDALRKVNGNTFGEERQTKELAAIYAFRSVFGSRAALYIPGENRELYNVTPYSFDYERIGKLEFEEMPYPLSVDGKRLLVFKSRQSMGDLNYGILYCADMTDIYQRTERIFFKGFAVTLVLLLMVGAWLFLGIYRSIRPLMELKKAASEIAGGSYGACVCVHGKDEIAQLGENFNHMSREVEARIEELRQVNQAQRRLIGSLAHELKTPMTAIIGYADTLLTVRLSEARREKALTYIGKECRRLSRLSVKMLELTGLYEEGEKGLALSKASVKELLETVGGLVKFKLAEKQITLEISCEPEELMLQMDVDLMTSLLLNLVDNACKASSEGGKILLHADETGLFVEDHGRGIPAEELARVTEAFYMVDKSRAKSAGSVGLGLALCKEIAQLHGGILRIESEEGLGTRVSVLWNEK